jgi:photosystem II stability/assembly factor-like uncharacterized protein
MEGRALEKLVGLDPVRPYLDDVERVARLEVFEELYADTTQAGDQRDNVSEREPVASSPRQMRGANAIAARRSARRRPVVRIGSIAAAVVLLVGVALSSLSSGGSGSFTTGWRPARAVPSAAANPVHLGPKSLRLTGVVAGSNWSRKVDGPAPSALTCPSVLACYAIGSPTAPHQYDAFYSSKDGGATWSVLPLPAGFAFTSRLACPSDSTCLAGGKRDGTAVVASTVSGGHRWTVVPLSTSGTLLDLVCASATVCSGITAASALPGLSGDFWPADHKPETFVHTTDAGQHWSSSAFPTEDEISAMDCPLPDECVAIGRSQNKSELTLDAFSLATTDAGKTWTAGAIPTGIGFDRVGSSVSCPDGTHCLAIALVDVPISQPCPAPGARAGDAPAGTDQQCTIKDRRSTVIGTSDGGHSWDVRPVPPDVPTPHLVAISCASVDDCSVGGEQDVPQQIGRTHNAASPLLASTPDEGVTWLTTGFASPLSIPAGEDADAFMSIGALSCPAPGNCTALGSARRGSTHTAVYSR